MKTGKSETDTDKSGYMHFVAVFVSDSCNRRWFLSNVAL